MRRKKMEKWNIAEEKFLPLTLACIRAREDVDEEGVTVRGSEGGEDVKEGAPLLQQQ